MKKRLWCSVLLAVFVVAFPISSGVVIADTEVQEEKMENSQIPDLDHAQKIPGCEYKEKQNSSFLGRQFAKLGAELAEVLIKATDAQGIGEIVFLDKQADPHDWPQWGWMDEKLWRVATFWYKIFLAIAMALFMITLYKSAYTIIVDIPNVIQRSVAKEEMANIFIGIIFMFAFPFIFWIFNDLNFYIVRQISNGVNQSLHMVGNLDGMGIESKDDAFVFGKLIYGYDFGDILLTAFAWLSYAIILVWTNFLFLVRKVLLVALYAISPLMAIFYMLGGAAKRTGYMTFLSEVMSNIFMQTCYAIAFGIALTLMAAWQPRGMIGIIFIRVMMLFFAVKLGSFLRRLICGWLNLLGFDEEGAAGQMTGMAVGMGLGTVRNITAGIAGVTGYVKGKEGKTAQTGGNTNTVGAGTNRLSVIDIPVGGGNFTPNNTFHGSNNNGACSSFSGHISGSGMGSSGGGRMSGGTPTLEGAGIGGRIPAPPDAAVGRNVLPGLQLAGNIGKVGLASASRFGGSALEQIGASSRNTQQGFSSNSNGIARDISNTISSYNGHRRIRNELANKSSMGFDRNS